MDQTLFINKLMLLEMFAKLELLREGSELDTALLEYEIELEPVKLCGVDLGKQVSDKFVK